MDPEPEADPDAESRPRSDAEPRDSNQQQQQQQQHAATDTIPAATPTSPSPDGDGDDDEDAPDLECAICFSEFNNVFRTPKVLSCRHTFCLECLARMNIKSAQPDSIQCPLCRGFTPLPSLGLPKLANDSTVLSYLPAAMQRVYSIRFSRSKGRLQVKRPAEIDPALAAASNTVSHSLDVGQPSGSGGGGRRGRGGGGGGAGGGGGGAGGQRSGLLGRLQRVMQQPACRVFIMIVTVLIMVMLTVLVIFLLAMRNGEG
ncbi:RING finger protein 225 [Engraulis encrasicolus]|uniref:RING finger protein 225 n=1 Tax=Engraulis encrasicolus TaxID=184585 RepID=UPI002FD1A84D